jgi:RND family efflux transporter MFP subunit
MALTQPQTVVLVLQETSLLEAYSAIPETQLSLIAVGDPALVFLQNADQPISTTVTTVSDAIDLATRTYQVRMLIPNDDRKLKAGVFARVEINPATRASALVVPREAVRTEDGETRVYVVQDGLAVAVPVRIGATSDSQAEVLSGLDEGVHVIVGEAARTIAAGMRVRVASATGREAA